MNRIKKWLVKTLRRCTSYIESLELSDKGVKINFRDLTKAEAAITGSNISLSSSFSSCIPHDEKQRFPFIVVAEYDPQLALIGLRREIEKRIRKLAEIYGIPKHHTLVKAIRDLAKKDIISAEEMNGLLKLISAFHNAEYYDKIESKVMEWVIKVGPKIIEYLDKKL